MGRKMILLCVIMFVVIARLSSARPNSRTKHRRNNKPFRRYCDLRAKPTHTRLAKLWSKLIFHLAVLFDGTLHGVNDTYCHEQVHRCLFELQSCGPSMMRIQHVTTGLYVAISKFGTVYTTLKSHRSDTVLVQELLPNGFTVFSSDRSQRKKKGLMFLALKKNGAPKNALKTSATHKSVHFTVILCTRKRKHLTMTGVSSTC